MTKQTIQAVGRNVKTILADTPGTMIIGKLMQSAGYKTALIGKWGLGGQDSYNRTNCCSERLTNYHIFVVDVPLTSTTLSATQGQSGVGDFHETGQAGSPTTTPTNTTGRYAIPISLNYCPLVLVKIFQGGVALNPNSWLLVNRAPCLIYFSCAQQEHKLNEIGIRIQPTFRIYFRV
jgi:hypothetical protein